MKKADRRLLGIQGVLVLIPIITLLFFGWANAAGDKYWAGGNGIWETGPWATVQGDPTEVPGLGDSVFIHDTSYSENGTSKQGAVSYNYIKNPILKKLEVDNLTGVFPNPTLNHESHTLTSESTVIGLSPVTAVGAAPVYNQSGGTHKTLGDLSLGIEEGSYGVFDMIDSIVSVGGFEKIGLAGAGDFNQRKSATSLSDNPTLGCVSPVKPPTTPPGPPPPAVPTHSIGKNLYLGVESTGVGFFNMEGGKLTVNGSIRVGLLGTGTFDQYQGTVTANGNDSEPLESTVQSGGNQEVFNPRRLRGKTSYLECHPTAAKGPALIIGYQNEGGYNLFGGTLNVGDSEIIGYAGPLSVGGSKIIGDGSFYQTGGKHNVSGNLLMSKQPGSTSEYSFYGPSIYNKTEPTPAEISLLDVRGFGSIGYEGEGYFGQIGGTVKFRGTDQELSNHKVSSGIGMALSKVSAIQNLSCNTQNHDIGLTIGREGKGEYDLTDGELLVSHGEIIGVFPLSEGIFAHTSGNHYVGGTLTIARDKGSLGTYNLYGGLLSANGGILNNGNFNVINGAAKMVSGAFINNKGGVVSVTNTNVTFTKDFHNYGEYGSTLSSSKFKNLTIKADGFIKPGNVIVGDDIMDFFTISGNFTNESTQISKWNTAFAEIKFTGAGTHYFKTGGNNFAWGAFSLDDKAVVRLQGDLSAKNINGVIADNTKIKNMYGFCGIQISYTDSNPDLEGKWLYTTPGGKKVGQFVGGQLDTSLGCK